MKPATMHGRNVPAPSPSPAPAIPPHLRPSASRQSSSASISSRPKIGSRSPSLTRERDHPHPHPHPHAQQTQYVPSSIGPALVGEPSPAGLAERALFARSDSDPAGEGSARVGAGEEGDDCDDHDDGDTDTDTDSQAEWAAARTSNHASTPAWRRASPRWVYPYIVGATLSLGMGMAPRSELYIDLACLAHPPEVPKSLGTTPAVGQSTLTHAIHARVAGGQWGGLEIGRNASTQTWSRSAVAAAAAIGTDHKQSGKEQLVGVDPIEMSPADKWFYDIQKEWWEYERAKRAREKPSSPTRPSDRGGAVPSPTGPLPVPGPGSPADPTRDSPENGDGEDSGRRKDKTGGTDDTDGESDEPSTSGPPFRQIDPALCKKSPVVQAAAAKLTMAMTVTGGILSALTTGHWGRLSDKIGRTRIFALISLGLAFNEVAFICVATFPHRMPGGYRALLLGPTFEGLVGGFSTLMATVNAYISDTTPDGSRATVFARLGGVAMTGFAMGPVLGAWLIGVTGNIMVPFYISACVNTAYILLTLLLLPESLSPAARKILQANARAKAAAAARKDAAAREWEDAEEEEGTEARQGAGSAWSRLSGMGEGAAAGVRRRRRMAGRLKRLGRGLLAPLHPLEVFLPRDWEDERDSGMGRTGKDWNMTYLGMAMFCMSTLLSFISIKAQYTFFAFGWTTVQLGPFMSLISFCRGFSMIVLIPLAMKLAKPYFIPRPTPPPSSSSSSESTPLISTPQPHTRRPAILDLYAVRLSLFYESLLLILLGTNPSPPAFIALSCLITLGSGHSPAANSLALTLVGDSRASGRLFGGLAVLNALGTSLIGPLVFGNLFSASVGKWAGAVFVLAGVVQFVAGCLFMGVRVRGGDEGGDAGMGAGGVGVGKKRRVVV